MDSNAQGLTIVIMLLAFAATVIATQVIRRRQTAFPIRVIPAYNALPLMVGASIEANQPLHMSLGSGGLGGRDTLLTLASAELYYQIGRQAAIGATSPLVTTSDSASIPLGYDILRRAYAARGTLENFDNRGVQWYPNGSRSLAFAAVVTAILGIEQVNANVLVGSFGLELALIAEGTQRRGQSLIAASDQLVGQAVAYAMADQPLIGEEIFSAGAYLGDEARYKAALITQDLLRWLLILLLILFAVVALAPEVAGPTLGEFLAGLQRTFSGG